MSFFFRSKPSPPAVFHRDASLAQQMGEARLPSNFVLEFLDDGRTPARALTDEALRSFLPFIEGDGLIIELGAGGDYYKAFVGRGQAYLTSNIEPGADLIFDMSRMNLPDDSVDAFLSVFALEHVFDIHSVFREQLRVLRPGGRLLLVVPFLYYQHSAPDDFFRFSQSALDNLLKPMHIHVRIALGCRSLLIAELLHEKVILGSRSSRIWRFMLRLLALPFLLKAITQKHGQKEYALANLYLCEKPKLD
jgi:SAM-dependent methyltransferase